jgi:hypothetical protein
VEDLRCLAAEANLVNPTITHDRLIRAIRDPGKALKILVARSKMAKKKSA